jgi:hypothetical protein
MPYPNSQSPITVRLNELFADAAAAYVPRIIDDLNDYGVSMGQVARQYSIARNAWEQRHIDLWPSDQLQHLRALLVQWIVEHRPVVFDWQEATTTRTDYMDFGARGPVAVTFRSPQVYPPYEA